MIDFSVPLGISRLLGTGTVALSAPGRFRRRIMWLPDCRTRTKPAAPRILQTSEADRGRSLGMAQFERLHGAPSLEAAFDFAGGSALEPEFDGFGQHGVCFLAGLALA